MELDAEPPEGFISEEIRILECAKRHLTNTESFSRRETSMSGIVAYPVQYPYSLARTWSEFLSAVRLARSELGNPDIVWYRGHSQAKYALTPSLLRHPEGLKKEEVLFKDYERSAAKLHAKRDNDWELLVDMQHYGIATRLLDWTDVLGIAIAFALYDSTANDVDSAIYVLDPLKLNALSGLREVKRVPNDPAFQYRSIYWEGKPLKAQAPIAIDCTFQNPRIAAQSGSFTVHGANDAPLEVQAPNSVRKIVLASSAKSEAQEFLDHANLNAFNIYPDIVGMAQHIMRKHLGRKV